MEIGELRYQQAMGFLNENRDAYALFDEAQRAIADDDLDIALLNLDSAMDMVPGEARFAGLKGDIQLYQEDYRDAINTYDYAIASDPNYFDYYLGRGVAWSRLGNNQLAKSDLEQSTSLLPTAVAMNELGKIALVENNRTLAKQYFQEAAGSEGNAGREAALSFTRIDIVDNPGNYVSARAFANEEGRIITRIVNNSPLNLTDLQISVAAVIGNRIGRRTLRLETLAPNNYRDIFSGLVFPEGQLWTEDQLSTEVVSASVE